MRDKDNIRKAGLLPLRGQTVHLREIEPTDVTDAYLGWMRDAELTRFMESRLDEHTRESLMSFVQTRRQSEREWMFAICGAQCGTHIGNIKLGPIHPHHLRADIGIIVGEREWHGRGVATESIRLVVDFAFRILGLAKLTAGMYAENIGSRRAFEKAGFTVEGVLRKHCIDALGTRVDLLALGLTSAAHIAEVE